jgi:hypothetical protein
MAVASCSLSSHSAPTGSEPTSFLTGWENANPAGVRRSPLFSRYTDAREDQEQLNTFCLKFKEACKGLTITEADYNAFLADMGQEDWPLRRPPSDPSLAVLVTLAHLNGDLSGEECAMMHLIIASEKESPGAISVRVIQTPEQANDTAREFRYPPLFDPSAEPGGCKALFPSPILRSVLIYENPRFYEENLSTIEARFFTHDIIKFGFYDDNRKVCVGLFSPSIYHYLYQKVYGGDSPVPTEIMFGLLPRFDAVFAAKRPISFPSPFLDLPGVHNWEKGLGWGVTLHDLLFHLAGLYRLGPFHRKIIEIAGRLEGELSPAFYEQLLDQPFYAQYKASVHDLISVIANRWMSNAKERDVILFTIEWLKEIGEIDREKTLGFSRVLLTSYFIKRQSPSSREPILFFLREMTKGWDRTDLPGVLCQGVANGNITSFDRFLEAHPDQFLSFMDMEKALCAGVLLSKRAGGAPSWFEQLKALPSEEIQAIGQGIFESGDFAPEQVALVLRALGDNKRIDLFKGALQSRRYDLVPNRFFPLFYRFADSAFCVRFARELCRAIDESLCLSPSAKRSGLQSFLGLRVPEEEFLPFISDADIEWIPFGWLRAHGLWRLRQIEEGDPYWYLDGIGLTPEQKTQLKDRARKVFKDANPWRKHLLSKSNRSPGASPLFPEWEEVPLPGGVPGTPEEARDAAFLGIFPETEEQKQLLRQFRLNIFRPTFSKAFKDSFATAMGLSEDEYLTNFSLEDQNHLENKYPIGKYWPRYIYHLLETNRPNLRLVAVQMVLSLPPKQRIIMLDTIKDWETSSGVTEFLALYQAQQPGRAPASTITLSLPAPATAPPPLAARPRPAFSVFRGFLRSFFIGIFSWFKRFL